MDDGALREILMEAVRLGATDVHLSAGAPPAIRIATRMRPLGTRAALSADQTRQLVGAALGGRVPPDDTGDADAALSMQGWRFRVHAYHQRGTLALACRVLPQRVPELSSLGLPEAVRRLADLERGLVLLCGPTGSGKTTTLAALINAVNERRDGHITTIEDPVEYVHTDKRSIVHQRELGVDTPGFAEALRAVLREDPDVILVGEMRDVATIDAALTAAETGHLVFSTLHTSDAESSISRMVNAFPGNRVQEARIRIATTLRAVVCQMLLPVVTDESRIGVVAELMINDPAVAALIREGNTHQLPSHVETGSRIGMQTFDQALATAVTDGWLDLALARAKCSDPRSFTAHLTRASA